MYRFIPLFLYFSEKRSFNALKMLCVELRFIDKWRQGCIQYSNIYNFLANFLTVHKIRGGVLVENVPNLKPAVKLRNLALKYYAQLSQIFM